MDVGNLINERAKSVEKLRQFEGNLNWGGGGVCVAVFWNDCAKFSPINCMNVRPPGELLQKSSTWMPPMRSCFNRHPVLFKVLSIQPLAPPGYLP